ncbi:MAG: TraR/DksA C4-type zinc finger protein [Desulfosalsimonas sp.]
MKGVFSSERWIRPARLEAMPYAVHCRRCQEEYERIENL